MAGAPSLGELLEGAVVRLLIDLPPTLQRLLAGGGAVRIDGQELAAETQLVLRLLALSGRRGVDTMSPIEARAVMARNTRVFRGSPPVVAHVADLTIPGPAGAIPARLYVPRDDASRRALVVYYHGGGWVVGDLDTHDSLCRFLADATDAAILAVDYRLAPEHRFPAAVDDALAAFRWAGREASALGFDPARVAVAGDSAGGNLAAVVAQTAARDGGPPAAAQLLIYPVTDLSTKHASYHLFAEGFFLTEKDMDWYRRQYLPDEHAARDPRASPLLAPDVHGLPTTIVVTAGFDVLRDEGEAYARRLRDAGGRVVLQRHAGFIHGFANTTGSSSSVQAAIREAARMLADVLAPA